MMKKNLDGSGKGLKEGGKVEESSWEKKRNKGWWGETRERNGGRVEGEKRKKGRGSWMG